MLLVSASRRRGELVPGTAPGFIGHPVTAVAIGVLFFAGVVLHGTVIWDRPLVQVAALAVAGGMLGVAVRRVAQRRVPAPRGDRAAPGARARPRPPRRHGRRRAGRAARSSSTAGRRRAGAFEHFSQLRRATVELPDGAPEEVAVWGTACRRTATRPRCPRPSTSRATASHHPEAGGPT